MNKKLIATGALTGLIMVGGYSTMVSAQSAALATGLTEEQVIEIALLEVPGEVLEVELEERRSTQAYEVEILSETGDEFYVMINAESGDVLKVRADYKDCDRDEDESDDDDDDEGEEV